MLKLTQLDSIWGKYCTNSTKMYDANELSVVGVNEWTVTMSDVNMDLA